MPNAVRRWFSAPDQFDRFTRFLRDNGILIPTRVVLGVLIFLMGTSIVFKRLGSRSESVGEFPFDIVIAALTLIAALVVPLLVTTRQRSYVMVFLADVAITVVVLTEGNLDQRLLGCLVFGIIGSYIAFFHSLRVQLPHLLAASAVIVVAALGVFSNAEPSTLDVLGRTVFAITVITVIPVVTQIALSRLSNDAQGSELDPLTDLLNRRGLARRTAELLHAHSEPDQSLLVVVIDIDNFKHFNDTYGHDVGDRVILRTAYRLHEWAISDAAIARVGGDEFIVVQIMPQQSVGYLLADIGRIMNMSAGEPASTTSIGIAIHNGIWADDEDMDEGIQSLHRLADSAMYESKRLGGNHVHSIVLTRPRD
ncbi:diguanylate cyclase domain-containing protein [Rhodococcus sp. 27YEA15]|uniref:GGDEF domain-containing protein n=1 Tax=Rhodococcus sp. 27YEA15 TaxID=3156259 RepID=UPI003C7CD1E1